MISLGHHVDAVIAHGEIFFVAIFVVVVANAKTIVRVDLEEIHLLVIRLAQQIIHLMFEWRIRAPVATRCERLTDDQSSSRQFGL